jgi:hypothetical protein
MLRMAGPGPGAGAGAGLREPALAVLRLTLSSQALSMGEGSRLYLPRGGAGVDCTAATRNPHTSTDQTPPCLGLAGAALSGPEASSIDIISSQLWPLSR